MINFIRNYLSQILLNNLNNKIKNKYNHLRKLNNKQKLTKFKIRNHHHKSIFHNRRNKLILELQKLKKKKVNSKKIQIY